jgi:hypothetical protein
MATPILQANPGMFNFRPTLLAPTQGDLEEARVKHLLDLAKLAQLQQEPLIQSQNIDLQRQRLALDKLGTTETGRHNVATEEQSNAALAEAIKQHSTDALLRQMGLNVEQRGQDITARGQDIGSQTAHDVSSAETERSKLNARTQTTDTLINAMLAHGDAMHPEQSMQLLAKVLAQRDNPELLNVLGEKQTNAKSATAEATLRLLRGDGTVGADGTVNPNAVIPKTEKGAELDSLLQNLLPVYGTGKKLNRATGNNPIVHNLLKYLVPLYGIPDELMGTH